MTLNNLKLLVKPDVRPCQSHLITYIVAYKKPPFSANNREIFSVKIISTAPCNTAFNDIIKIVNANKKKNFGARKKIFTVFYFWKSLSEENLRLFLDRKRENSENKNVIFNACFIIIINAIFTSGKYQARWCRWEKRIFGALNKNVEKYFRFFRFIEQKRRAQIAIVSQSRLCWTLFGSFFRVKLISFDVPFLHFDGGKFIRSSNGFTYPRKFHCRRGVAIDKLELKSFAEFWFRLRGDWSNYSRLKLMKIQKVHVNSKLSFPVRLANLFGNKKKIVSRARDLRWWLSCDVDWIWWKWERGKYENIGDYRP